jgi:hypothetical protein
MALARQTLKDNETLERSKLTAEEQSVYDDIMSNGLQNKFDEQLVEMKTSYTAKKSVCEKYRDELNLFPQYFEMPIYRNLIEDGWRPTDAKAYAETNIATKYIEASAKYDSVYKIAESLIPQEQTWRVGKEVVRSPVGTTYYADSDNGSDSNDGLGTGSGNAWLTMDKYVESARSAGDILICRAGRTLAYDSNSSLNTNGDGLATAHIIVSADYGDAWGDHVNTSGTATVTTTHGSKIVTATADISSVVAAGDMIYISGDDNLRFAYEVESVSTVTVTLFLPYKGDTEGSTKTLINMQAPPVWDDSNGVNTRIVHASDAYWWWRGIRVQSNNATKTSGIIDISNTAYGILLTDMQFVSTTGGTNEYGIWFGNEYGYASLIHKCRTFNFRRGFYSEMAGSTGEHITLIRDCLFDGNNATSSVGIMFGNSTGGSVIETEMKNNATRDLQLGGYSNAVKTLNCIQSSSTPYFVGSGPGSFLRMNDHNQSKTDHREMSGDDYVAFRRSTSVSRMGADGAGSAYVLSVESYDKVGGEAYNEVDGIVPFDYAIRHDTDQFTCDVWLRTNETADWTTDPTADELYIELSYRKHATNMARYSLRSTGVLDFNGSTAWQKLTVTATPGQDGIAYLKLYYGKVLEDVDDFYVDPRPEIYKS